MKKCWLGHWCVLCTPEFRLCTSFLFVASLIKLNKLCSQLNYEVFSGDQPCEHGVNIQLWILAEISHSQLPVKTSMHSVAVKASKRLSVQSVKDARYYYWKILKLVNGLSCFKIQKFISSSPLNKIP
jgi:hypothetical protein